MIKLPRKRQVEKQIKQSAYPGQTSKRLPPPTTYYRVLPLSLSPLLSPLQFFLPLLSFSSSFLFFFYFFFPYIIPYIIGLIHLF